MLLTKVLSILSSDTRVILYYRGNKVGECLVYEFPYRHELNEFYRKNVEEIEAVDKLKVKIFLK